MDNRLQATFMPRSPGGSGDNYPRRKSPPNFFMGIGVLLFILSLGATGALYAYKNVLRTNNETKRASIQEAIRNFEPELTKELTTLKKKIDAANALVKNHKAFTLLLDLMETNTAQTVRFRDLSYMATPDNKISLSMVGEARSYNAIAFQSDVFSKIPQLKNPMFTDLSLDDKGIISFKVAAELDPNAVNYSRSVVIPTPTTTIVPIQTATSTPGTATSSPISTSTPRS